jgi:hypothetical protein
MSHVSQKFGQFVYFDIELGHPSWNGKTVLDFGGNAGNFLKTHKRQVDDRNYWCIDVSADGIAAGKRDFPNAHWFHYDRYNINFNPSGAASLDLPEFAQRFDYILAYSVFTHMDVWEMDYFTSRLLALLNPGGAFAFTFIDHNFVSWPGEYAGNNLMWRLDRMKPSGKADAGIVDRVKEADWFRLTGDTRVYLGDEPIPAPERYEGLEYHVFHTADFMRRHFPGAQILPPANGEMQHCCVLKRPE